MIEVRLQLEQEMGEPITLDALTAGWRIAQRKNGHRHSIDDVLTAWYALEVSPPVREYLDLGTGIGTVGLLTLWGMGAAARLTCVEAQAVSYRLLRANIEMNGLEQRVTSVHGDLRELALGQKFPLITGSPPYFPRGTGVLPQDSQKAHARFELRGDVSDYALAAAAHLSDGGWFILCFPSPQKQRAWSGIEAAGLKVVRWREVIPRESLAPLFTLFACQWNVAGSAVEEEPFMVRHLDGRLTAQMAAVRRVFGFADGEAHGGYG